MDAATPSESGFGGAAGTLVVTPPQPTVCGDGKLADDEACDDGNTNDGDGCSANCKVVGASYSCNPVGQPCRIIARCGDGIVAASEACDDGNTTDGDGCSSRCKLETGFKCAGQPSACTHTTCGDGIREGTEGCDDGNSLPFDGCSSDCQTEPTCTGASCTSDCGDGLVLNEECDDGNKIDGDGCSSTCHIEPGFTCGGGDGGALGQVGGGGCEMVNGQCILRVSVIYRDFSDAHPDFGVGCDGPVANMVQPLLNAQGKPVLSAVNGIGAACVTSAATFAQWYTDGTGRLTYPSSLVLFDNGAGGFVNRWGPNGEQWLGQPVLNGQIVANSMVTCGQTGDACATCMPPLGAGQQCFDPCTPQNNMNQSCGVRLVPFDGNPLFFPLDNVPSATIDPKVAASVAPTYGWPYTLENQLVAGAPPHNFFFTTEVHYWFKFNAAQSATLDFTGDDDVWVFLNGKLAVDLGGLHSPLNGNVSISAQTATTFGLVDGQVYEISVFHAERKVNGSSFRLTLEGFQTSRSDCSPICGDGIVSAGEECDDGVNDGGYGECAPGCVLGPYCGDGIVQTPEDCDDGNRFDGDGCGSACRNLIVK
jgi:fibro-slime domain-containing protein